MATSSGEAAARIAVLLIAVSAFNNYRRGDLGLWVRAKLFNMGDATSARTAADVFAGAGTSNPPGTPAPATGFAEPAGLIQVAGTRLSPIFGARVKAAAAEAAKAGVTLTGDGYRSSAEQFRLRGAHGCAGREMDPTCKCNPPTAVPGHSRHETGNAIDFSNCQTHASPVYRWLAAHGASFGLYNLPSEPWHWSIDGS